MKLFAAVKIKIMILCASEKQLELKYGPALENLVPIVSTNSKMKH